jgi:type I restriction enzyme S subunit
MSKIDELIAELCPGGVEYKKIKEVYTRLKGTPITAGKMREIQSTGGDIKIFAGGRTVIDAFEQDIPGANVTRVPAVLVQSRGVIDAVFYEKPFTFKNEMWAYTANEKISVKYLYYVLKNNIGYFRDTASSMGSLPQISLKVTEDFKMPVPPLKVQRIIVATLDTFTEIESKLEAELEARKKQYEFYRKQLLTFDEGVVRKQLGEMGKVSMCKRIMKDQTKSTGDIPFYKIGTFGKRPNAYISQDIYHAYRNKFSFPKKGDVLISASGTIGRTVVYDGEPAYFQDSNIIWLDNDEKQVTNKFLLHLYEIVTWQTEGGTIKRLYNDNFKKVEIPVPPIEEQNRIVSVLDKFEKLTTDISEGLPAELNVRRKQYEYYRNKLLTFPELANA